MRYKKEKNPAAAAPTWSLAPSIASGSGSTFIISTMKIMITGIRSINNNIFKIMLVIIESFNI